MSTSSRKHTLFLWPLANFPRRLTYHLILKGLVTNPKDLATGKTNIPNLSVNIVSLDLETDSWETSDPNDAFPDGNRHPLLRIYDTDTKQTTWIHESRSILNYFEATFPGPKLDGGDALSQAVNSDLIGLVDEAISHIAYYAKHASKTAWQYFDFPNEARSKVCAIDAKKLMNKALLRLQTWAIDNGSLTETHPWLAVKGTSEVGPGFPDLCLVAWWRYVDVGFDDDVLEMEELGPLRRARDKFVELKWWEEAENLEHGFAKTPAWMRHGKEDLEY